MDDLSRREFIGQRAGTVIQMKPTKGASQDFLKYLKAAKPNIKRWLKQLYQEKMDHTLKWSLCSHVEMIRPLPDGREQKDKIFFTSKTYTFSPSKQMIREQITDAFSKMDTSMMNFIRAGSG